VFHPPSPPPLPPLQDEAAAAEAALAARHAAELEAAAAVPADDDAPAAPADAAAAALARFGVDDDAAAPAPASAAVRKTSRAARRRADKATRDAEREAERDAERAAAAGTGAGSVEAAALDAVLKAESLAIVDIPPDGHCLYASLADQLVRTGRADGGGGVAGLRAVAAAHLRAHAAAFAPFIEDADGVDAAPGADPAARVAAYADAVEGTAAWGGHCELAALAAALGVRVRVLSADAPPVVVAADAADAADAPTLTVAYMRHAFALGEHYNSTRERGGEGEGEDGEEGDFVDARPPPRAAPADGKEVWSGSE
jgi:OTU domain-containing protein 6